MTKNATCLKFEGGVAASGGGVAAVVVVVLSELHFYWFATIYSSWSKTAQPNANTLSAGSLGP